MTELQLDDDGQRWWVVTKTLHGVDSTGISVADSCGIRHGPYLTEKAAQMELEAMDKDLVPGGLADDVPASAFDPEQLEAGVKVEMEHTDDPAVAREIASDHLTEDPDYYRKLAQVDKSSYFETCERDDEGHCKPGDGSGGDGGESGLGGGLNHDEVESAIERAHADAACDVRGGKGKCADVSVALWDELGKPKDLVPFGVSLKEGSDTPGEDHVVLLNVKTGAVVDPTGYQYDKPTFTDKQSTGFIDWTPLSKDQMDHYRIENLRSQRMAGNIGLAEFREGERKIREGKSIKLIAKEFKHPRSIKPGDKIDVPVPTPPDVHGPKGGLGPPNVWRTKEVASVDTTSLAPGKTVVHFTDGTRFLMNNNATYETKTKTKRMKVAKLLNPSEESENSVWVMTTGDTDRDDETVDPEGGDFTEFDLNPVLVDNHDTDGSVTKVILGKVVRRWNEEIGEGTRWAETATGAGLGPKRMALLCEVAWNTATENGRQAQEMAKGGFLNGASISFLPQDTPKKNNRGGNHYARWKLLEFTLCPVGSNPSALRLKSASRKRLKVIVGKSHDKLFQPPYRASRNPLGVVDAVGDWVTTHLTDYGEAEKMAEEMNAGKYKNYGQIRHDAKAEVEVGGDGFDVWNEHGDLVGSFSVLGEAQEAARRYEKSAKAVTRPDGSFASYQTSRDPNRERGGQPAWYAYSTHDPTGSPVFGFHHTREEAEKLALELDAKRKKSKAMGRVVLDRESDGRFWVYCPDDERLEEGIRGKKRYFDIDDYEQAKSFAFDQASKIGEQPTILAANKGANMTRKLWTNKTKGWLLKSEGQLDDEGNPTLTKAEEEYLQERGLDEVQIEDEPPQTKGADYCGNCGKMVTDEQWAAAGDSCPYCGAKSLSKPQPGTDEWVEEEMAEPEHQEKGDPSKPRGTGNPVSRDEFTQEVIRLLDAKGLDGSSLAKDSGHGQFIWTSYATNAMPSTVASKIAQREGKSIRKTEDYADAVAERAKEIGGAMQKWDGRASDGTGARNGKEGAAMFARMREDGELDGKSLTKAVDDLDAAVEAAMEEEDVPVEMRKAVKAIALKRMKAVTKADDDDLSPIEARVKDALAECVGKECAEGTSVEEAYKRCGAKSKCSKRLLARVKGAVLKAVEKADTVFVPRSDYDRMISQDPKWMKEVWPTLNAQWGIGGATVKPEGDAANRLRQLLSKSHRKSLDGSPDDGPLGYKALKAACKAMEDGLVGLHKSEHGDVMDGITQALKGLRKLMKQVYPEEVKADTPPVVEESEEEEAVETSKSITKAEGDEDEITKEAAEFMEEMAEDSPDEVAASLKAKAGRLKEVNKTPVPARDLVGNTGAQAMVEGKYRYVINAAESGGKVTIEYGDSGGAVDLRRSYSPDQLLDVKDWHGKSNEDEIVKDAAEYLEEVTEQVPKRWRAGCKSHAGKLKAISKADEPEEKVNRGDLKAGDKVTHNGGSTGSARKGQSGTVVKPDKYGGMTYTIRWDDGGQTTEWAQALDRKSLKSDSSDENDKSRSKSEDDELIKEAVKFLKSAAEDSPPALEDKLEAMSKQLGRLVAKDAGPADAWGEEVGEGDTVKVLKGEDEGEEGTVESKGVGTVSVKVLGRIKTYAAADVQKKADDDEEEEKQLTAPQVQVVKDVAEYLEDVSEAKGCPRHLKAAMARHAAALKGVWAKHVKAVTKADEPTDAEKEEMAMTTEEREELNKALAALQIEHRSLQGRMRVIGVN